MGMGQAAGAAAAMAVRTGCAPRGVDVPSLQARLLADGAILQAPQSEVQVGDPRW
jgi:hypothetical protein